MSQLGSVAKSLASNGIFMGGVLAIGVVGVVWWKWGDKLKDAFNPTSDKNLAYSGVNAVGAAVSGDEHWTLGGYIFDLFHERYDPNKPPAGAAIVKLQGQLPADPSKRPQTLK